MGLLESIFQKKPKALLTEADSYFKTFTAYQPVFTSWNGQLYECELVRASVDARARHISTLKVAIKGSAKPKLQTMMKHAPNEFQTWSQFLYRLSTILDMQNTAFIIPVIDRLGEVTGYFPVLPSQCALLQTKSGKRVLKYTFLNGETAACYLEECGIMTKFQYKQDFFGETNAALNETMQLINIQNQGIEEGVKNASTYRFMATSSNFAFEKDLQLERQRFSKLNFSKESEAGGLLLFPNTYKDIKQITSNAFNVDPEQRKLIEKNVYDYFGVNEKILQNIAFGDDLDAFFAGAVEPFSVQFSEVMTKISFTKLEQSNGAQIVCVDNRLIYMPVSQKINLIKALGDRGIITINEAREMLGFEPVEKGDMRPIRGEFYDAEVGKEGEDQDERDT